MGTLVVKRLNINNFRTVHAKSKNQGYCKKGYVKSSNSRMFFKISVPKNLAKFTGKQLCWVCIKMRLQRKYFPVSSFSFAKFLRIPLSQNTFQKLLLKCAIKVIFTVFELFLFQCRSVFWPTERVTDRKG